MGFFDKLKAACALPDYEGYLKQFAAEHPGETPLSKEEFLAAEREKMQKGA